LGKPELHDNLKAALAAQKLPHLPRLRRALHNVLTSKFPAVSIMCSTMGSSDVAVIEAKDALKRKIMLNTLQVWNLVED
jgi:hypothetical protein